ncbi:MAG: VanZ family protein, partial [Candidatus Aminicenantaceae bacterium]
AVVILIGGSIPVSHFSKLSHLNRVFRYLFSDESLHFFLFGFLAWLLCFGYYMAGRKKIPYVRIFLLSLGYGTLLEAWQAILPFRHFDKRDILLDFIGISAFMIAFWVMKRWGIILKKAAS